MRLLEIVVLSVAAGLIVTAFLVLPEILAAPSALTLLAMARWLELTIDWLSAYGLAALLLTAGALPPTGVPRLGRHGAISGSASGQSSALRRYLIGLAVVQFDTAVVALLALGSWRLIAEGAPLSGAAIIGSEGLRGGLGLILAAVLGGVAVAAATERRRDQGVSASSETAELRLLRQIDQRLTAQPSLAASEREERAQLMATIEASQRPVLEAAKNLTTAVNRLGRGLKRTLGEIRDAMPPQEQGWRGPGAAAPPSTEGVTAELWAAVGALSESIAKLGDLAPPASAGQHNMPASLAQLSTELDALLHEIDRDWTEDEPQS
jgi:hypothetical protein